jgi:hypothetical protein
MKTIKLKTGELLQIDDEDFDRCVRYKWYRKTSCSGTFYAVANTPRVNGVGGRIYAHQLVMNTSKGSPDLDHRDGNGLNCQKENLRFTDDLKNARGFRKKQTGKTSRFRGVSWCKKREMFRARIEFKRDGRRCSACGGFYDDEEMAALAYNQLAVDHDFFPEALNVVPQKRKSA